MSQDGPDSGWDLVTREDDAAALIGTLIDLDSEKEYARSELAEEADIPLKALYLVDTLDELVDVGMLERVNDESDDSEARFTLNDDSKVLAAAQSFDEAFFEKRVA
jgi:hypothetical protein